MRAGCLTAPSQIILLRFRACCALSYLAQGDTRRAAGGWKKAWRDPAAASRHACHLQPMSHHYIKLKAGPAGPAKPAPENDWKPCENPGTPFPLLWGSMTALRLRQTCELRLCIDAIMFRPDNFRHQRIPKAPMHFVEKCLQISRFITACSESCKNSPAGDRGMIASHDDASRSCKRHALRGCPFSPWDTLVTALPCEHGRNAPVSQGLPVRN